MSIPIPTRFRWTRHTGRLTADHGDVHVLLDHTVTLNHVDGLPDGLTEVDCWGPDARGLMRIGCDREADMSPDQQRSWRVHCIVLAIEKLQATLCRLLDLKEKDE